MILLLNDTIKFTKCRENKIINLMSLTNVNKLHITRVNIGDMIYDINGSIGTITNNDISKNTCSVLVLSINNLSNKSDDDTIYSYR